MKITLDIPDSHIVNAVHAGLFSGRYGIGYWGVNRAWNFRTMRGQVTEHMDERDDTNHVHHALTPARLKAGAALLAKHCPEMFVRLVENNCDGPLGDNLLQLAIFGEIKYA